MKARRAREESKARRPKHGSVREGALLSLALRGRLPVPAPVEPTTDRVPSVCWDPEDEIA